MAAVGDDVPEQHNTTYVASAGAKGARMRDPAQRRGLLRQLLVLFLLACTIGLSIACLCAYKTGWARYNSPAGHSTIFPLVPSRPFPHISIWVGWIKGSDTIRQTFAFLPRYAYLDAVSSAGQVWGGFTAGFFCIGLLVAAALFMLTLMDMLRPRRTGPLLAGRWLWLPSLIMAILLWIFTVGLFLFMYYGVPKLTYRTLGVHLYPDPDWAFYCGIFSAFAWFLIFLIGLLMPQRRTTGAAVTPVDIVPVADTTGAKYPSDSAAMV